MPMSPVQITRSANEVELPEPVRDLVPAGGVLVIASVRFAQSSGH